MAGKRVLLAGASADQLTAPHPPFEPSAIGQVIEWLVWSHLVASSSGALRVFLPTRDMGIDGIVHRPSTDAFVAVQVKGRSRLEEGVLRIHVQEDEVQHPATVVVAVVVDLDNNTLRDPVLVMTAVQLREHAHLIQWGPRMAYAITVPYPPGERTHWRDLCLPLSQMADHVCPPSAGVVERDWSPPPVPPAAVADQQDLATTGFIGEAALLHQAALSPVLNTFHASPDMGFDEYVIRHVGTGGLAAIQVKCIEVTDATPFGLIHIPQHTLTASPRAWLTVFFRRPAHDVHSPCLLIPARDIPTIPHSLSDGRLHISVNTGALGHLARYAVDLATLPAALERAVCSPS